MSSRDVRSGVAVQVPGAADDRPSWFRVSVISALGFLVGVAWPRMAGVRLGPNAPGEGATAAAPSALRVAEAPVSSGAPVPLAASSAKASTSASQGHVQAKAAANPPPTSAASPAVVSASTPAGGPKAVSALSVGPSLVISCRTTQGEFLKGPAVCGAAPAMDEFVLPRLRRLTQCPTADGAVGKLNIVLSVDFDGNKVIPSIGRGTTVENPDTFLGCTQSAFQMPNLAGIEHAHPRYTVAYGLDFSAPPGTNANPGIGAAATAGTRLPGRTLAGAKESVAGTGTFVQGQVMWEVAIVRDTPRTGQVVGRVHRGMNVQVGRAQDGWYRIKFGPDFSSEGWIYRGAIGR